MADDILERRFQKPGNWRWGSITNADGHLLRYGTAPAENPVAHVIYVQGRGESAEMGFELARDFNSRAFSYSVLDRHGQGLSGRLLKDIFKQHSKGTAPDVRDLLHFIEQVEPAPGKVPVILLGHSTGAIIAMMAAHDAPERVRGLVLAAPLLGIADSAVRDREHIWAKLPLPQFVREWYIPHGNADWDRDSPLHSLKPGDYSSDPHRMRLHDHWMRTVEGVRVASPTIGWVQDICRALVTIRSPGYLENIPVPVRMFTAGQDVKVNNHYAFEAANHLPDAVLTHFGQAKHDMLQEINAFRSPIIETAAKLACG